MEPFAKINIITPYLIAFLACTTTALDYFPDGYFNSSDLTTITWAHAVNSKSLLAANLKNDSIQMLEADLVMGKVTGTNETNVVIMAHPPATESDLSFINFLEDVVSHNKDLTLEKRKGIKLDFKDPLAADASLALLLQRNNSNPELYRFPIWINADVLRGPVNASSVNVNGTFLMQKQKSNLPQSTLSLGWTTRFGQQSGGEIILTGTYSREQVQEMADLIKAEFVSDLEKSNAQVTFPLRAGIAVDSIDNIKYLLDDSGIDFSSPSVTLWEGGSDPPLNITKLNAFIEALDKSRVFLDLPYTLGRGGTTDYDSASWSVSCSKTLIFIIVSLLTGMNNIAAQ